MGTITELLTLFVFLAAGMVFGMKMIPTAWSSITNTALNVCLYMLLFFMGVRTGLIANVADELTMIGQLAFLFATVTVIGSAFFVILMGRLFHMKDDRYDGALKTPDREQYNEHGSRNGTFSHLKEPLRLLFFALAGASLAALTPWFFWFTDSVTNIMVYLLLFLVGIQLVQSNTDMISVLKDPTSLLLPFGTIIGTLAASCLIPLVTNINIHESLAIASGFGWYSLSGVLITDLGDPVLGSVAFLSNLFRESIAFLVIPLLASYGKPHAAISIGGATSMDVTLPVIKKSCGTEYVPLSIAHGSMLTIVVPFLVPLFYTWG